MEELKSCPFCGKPLYIKIKRYTKPLLAPLTPAAALRDELIDITGEDYVPIKAEYCPVCGKPLNHRAAPENDYTALKAKYDEINRYNISCTKKIDELLAEKVAAPENKPLKEENHE